jgi:hypothetical protein
MATLGLLMTLIVRLYDNGSMSAADRALTIATAGDILLASSVPTSWPDCAPSPKPKQTAGGFVCDRPMSDGEVAVRLVRDTAPHAGFQGDLPLGYSLIDAPRRRGALATIYLDRVEWIAADAGVDARIVLGRAIAHEIGHMLLGTTAHSSGGLMRAIWSRQTLEQGNAADWLFTPPDAAALRRAFGRRVPVTQTVGNIVWGVK